MEGKTYTRRENAKRAAIAAGVPGEQVEITVHKSGDRVRFGWTKRAADLGPQGARVSTTSTQGAATTKKRPTAPPNAPGSEKPNVVRRPRAGGLCAAVWLYLDNHSDTTAKDIQEVADAKGWNHSNALQEMYRWRRFMRASQSAPQPTEA